MGKFFNAKVLNEHKFPNNMEAMRRDFISNSTPVPEAMVATSTPIPAVITVTVNPDLPVVQKKWFNMNATERKLYRKAKQNVG